MTMLIAHKVKMTQIFDDRGRVWPVTVVKMAPDATLDGVAEGAAVAVSGLDRKSVV